MAARVRAGEGREGRRISLAAPEHRALWWGWCGGFSRCLGGGMWRTRSTGQLWVVMLSSGPGAGVVAAPSAGAAAVSRRFPKLCWMVRPCLLGVGSCCKGLTIRRALLPYLGLGGFLFNCN